MYRYVRRPTHSFSLITLSHTISILHLCPLRITPLPEEGCEERGQSATPPPKCLFTPRILSLENNTEYPADIVHDNAAQFKASCTQASEHCKIALHPWQDSSAQAGECIQLLVEIAAALIGGPLEQAVVPPCVEGVGTRLAVAQQLERAPPSSHWAVRRLKLPFRLHRTDPNSASTHPPIPEAIHKSSDELALYPPWLEIRLGALLGICDHCSGDEAVYGIRFENGTFRLQ